MGLVSSPIQYKLSQHLLDGYSCHSNTTFDNLAGLAFDFGKSQFSILLRQLLGFIIQILGFIHDAVDGHAIQLVECHRQQPPRLRLLHTQCLVVFTFSEPEPNPNRLVDVSLHFHFRNHRLDRILVGNCRERFPNHIGLDLAYNSSVVDFPDALGNLREGIDFTLGLDSFSHFILSISLSHSPLVWLSPLPFGSCSCLIFFLSSKNFYSLQ